MYNGIRVETGEILQCITVEIFNIWRYLDSNDIMGPEAIPTPTK